MILLISSITKAPLCAQALQEATDEPVVVCAGLQPALTQLQVQEFSAVVFDQLLLDAEPDEGESLWKYLGGAVPVHANLAICAPSRVVRELRFAMQRHKRELLAAREEAEHNLRHDLKDTATALLLSCQMALQVPDLPALAESKMQAVEALAREISTRLGEAT